eukprot:GHVL01030726.1.p1 GENE.GHVL01030726.1~~GHVL01030726.1.p1  ORF type:complete len:1418 (+),score=213.35 GHVL01030726.1:2784-7037(+)
MAFRYEPAQLLTLFRAHTVSNDTARLVARLLDFVKCQENMLQHLPQFTNILQRISSLSSPEYASVSMRARQLLLTRKFKPFNERTSHVDDLLARLGAVNIESINNCVDYPDDSLIFLFSRGSNLNVKELSFELFIRRHYEASGLHDLRLGKQPDTTEMSPTLPEEEKPLTVKIQDIQLAVWYNSPMLDVNILRDADMIRHTDDPTTTQGFPSSVGATLSSQTSMKVTDDAPGGDFCEDMSRFRHILHSFDNGAGYAQANIGSSQQTVALAFDSFESMRSNLKDFLGEVKRLITCGAIPATPTSTSSSSAVDARVLMLFVGEMCQAEDATAQLLEHIDREATKLITEICCYSLSIAFLGGSKQDVDGINNRRRFASIADQTNLLAQVDNDLITKTTPCYIHLRSNFTFSKRTATKTDSSNATFVEETLLRNVEPSFFSNLELRRLQNFKVRPILTTSPHIHLYEALPKMTKDQLTPARIFVRIFTRLGEDLSTDEDEWDTEQERYFVLGLNALETAMNALSRSGTGSKLEGNHILMNVIPHDRKFDISHAENVAKSLAKRYEQRLFKTAVTCIEMRYLTKRRTGSNVPMADLSVPVRFVIDNPTGQSLRLRKFVEVTNPTTGDKVFSSMDQQQKGDCDYDSLPVLVPHPLSKPLDQKRAVAAALGSVYVYDFLTLFNEAVKKQWRMCRKYLFPSASLTTSEKAAAAQLPASAANESFGSVLSSFLPATCFKAVELVVNKLKDGLDEVHREIGMNTCGMVAWKVIMWTPEFPKGRKMILIGNDVTFQMGTFGVEEDDLFHKASQLAREQGIPRVYLAVNSGARMGLAVEVQKLYKVEWIDAKNPVRGFKYIYLKDEDYHKIKESVAVDSRPIHHPTDGLIHKITDIIGKQVGLGVENLCGSGAIAGETSRAARETFTLTFVTGRNVGIGSYITRLGQRVIQKTGAPILLTGYQALNRLIGRPVYISNDEIGGIDVMWRNGVTHCTVKSDVEGCDAILDWLAYIPQHRDGPLPIMVDTTDPVTRPVSYRPSSSTDDPRLMLTGCTDDKTGEFVGGIFDRESFKEYLPEWAKSVIVGRARLGGIPLGVILVETRTTQSIHPADPAMPNTSEVCLLRAGQVWFPDSSFKTAQSITDFNREELPLMIFANWRGFSGGQSDMFHEILKFGSYIVDALVDFKQPCIVYIPPKGELRGGAWVVVDPRINPDYMEMFADTQSRGGVLEPTGTVEIKYRERALIETAYRLDPQLQDLKKQDHELASQGVAVDATKRQTLKEAIDKRLADLLPVYKQVALHFADLHDTSVRMKRTKAVHDCVSWESSRKFFYWRLRRQLLLFDWRKEIIKNNPNMSLTQASEAIKDWAEEQSVDWNDTLNLTTWASQNSNDILRKIDQLRADYIASQTGYLCQENVKVVQKVVEGFHAT